MRSDGESREPSEADETTRLRAALTERGKELEGLYAVAELAVDPRADLDRVFARTTQLLPGAWQYPHAAGARIRFGGQEYRSDGFRQTPWCQRASFCDEGELAICYTEAVPEADEGPFLHEERMLLDAVARQLCAAVRARASDAALSESREALAHRLAVEKLVARIAASFVGAPRDAVDERVDAALGRMGQLTGASRCYLFRVSADGRTMDNTHEWCGAGVVGAKDDLQGLSTEVFPWWMAQLRQDREIDLRTLDDLPTEAAAERETLEAQSITSLLVVPVWQGASLSGFLGFDWVGPTGVASDDDKRMLRLVAQIVGDAIARAEGEARRARLHRALRLSNACAGAVIHARDERMLLRRVCDLAVAEGGYRFAWAGDAEPGEPIDPVAWAGEDGDYLSGPRVTWDDSPTGNGPGGRAVKSGEVQVVTRLQGDPSFEPWARAAAAQGFRAVIALPLAARGQVFGLLAIYSADADVFAADEVDLLSALAENLAFGVDGLRERAARKAAQAALLLRTRAIESAANGIVVMESRTEGPVIVYANPAFERITGYSAGQAIGKPPNMLGETDEGEATARTLRAALDARRHTNLTLRIRRNDGNRLWVECSLSPVFDDTGPIGHLIAVLDDISERKAYEEQLRFHAHYDELTRLPNRYLMRDRMSQALARARRDETIVAVLYLDLDRFQRFNESLGHTVGDNVLVEVADRVRRHLRGEDTVARYTGDEFVVVLSGVEREAGVGLRARRLLAALTAPLEVSGQRVRLTASAGIALFPRDGDDADALLRNAAAALHEAKRNGRDSVQFYRQSLNERLSEHLSLEGELQRAIEQGELRLQYQPQYRLSDGRMVGLEALVRWLHPRLGLLPPARFIPVAEDSGLIGPLGEEVLRLACRQLHQWRGSALGALTVAVNLSVRQLADDRLVEMVEAQLRETGVPPTALELEVTESALSSDPQRMQQRLARLKSLGCRLALDDFGTGYSNLGYLKRFAFDRLKIDRSFVCDMVTEPQDAAIVRTIIAMARALRMEVLAEGVERPAQLHYLRRQGCGAVQGFLLAKPQDPEELENACRIQGLPGCEIAIAAPERPALLVVDDEHNVVAALKRVLHGAPFRVIATEDPGAVFELLALNDVRVIVADQRMPTMSGTELLSKVKELYPDVIRIVLSGYTDLATITEAVNRGWVYKFLTKPWDDTELQKVIEEAFVRYERRRDERSEGLSRH